MRAARVVIPEGLAFADLALRRDLSTREIAMDWRTIEAICEASGIDPTLFEQGPEGNVAGLIVSWYQRHRELGGEPDAVAEQLLAEAMAEEVYGEGMVQPGSAEPQ